MDCKRSGEWGCRSRVLHGTSLVLPSALMGNVAGADAVIAELILARSLWLFESRCWVVRLQEPRDQCWLCCTCICVCVCVGARMQACDYTCSFVRWIVGFQCWHASGCTCSSYSMSISACPLSLLSLSASLPLDLYLCLCLSLSISPYI